MDILKLLLVIVLSTASKVVKCSKLTYERGHCDISIASVVQDMFKNEMRALLDPSLRYSSIKRIRYDLYTRKNPHNLQSLPLGDASALKNSYFNPDWPVRFSIHGWAGKSTTCSNAAIKDAYLARGDFNVILVDWSEHAMDISYSRISKQLSTIAANFVKFIRFLHRETGVPYENIYLIGHSAGCHLSGFAGKILKPDQLGAIIALDPAGLSQLGLSEEHRLAPTDALYVESIHTDLGLLGNPSTELSHAAFFPNWGQGQPQCPNATAAEFDLSCDHFAALYYFAESVRNPKLYGAIQCKNARDIEKFTCGCESATDTCAADAFMGGEPAIPKSGIYYCSTLSKAPFGYGEVVRVQPPTKSNFLKSSVMSSSRFIKKNLFRYI